MKPDDITLYDVSLIYSNTSRIVVKGQIKYIRDTIVPTPDGIDKAGDDAVEAYEREQEEHDG